MSLGKVFIVGAGPGSPDLISVRGFRALLACDTVLVDRLLPRNFLEDLGLVGHERLIQWLGDDTPRLDQQQINEWLVSHARAGQVVVRLKGGDPFVFGRGEEEAAALSAAGIPWEVIPGASASTAVPTASGFPLTRHAQGRSFAVATAKIVGGAISQTFPRADSLVILMGVASLENVAARLLDDGWTADTPTAAIESGTLAWERRVEGTLSEISQLAQQAGLASPATLIVGEAAAPGRAARQRRTVLFTGLDSTSFQWLGNLLHWPALQLTNDDQGQHALSAILPRLRQGEFDWMILTDKPAVYSLLAALRAQGLDARALADTRIAALGAAALRLKEFGLLPDAMGDPFTIVDAMQIQPGQSVLVIQGTHAVQQLRVSLATIDATVTAVQLHRLVPHPELGRPLPDHDAIYFVGPSAARVYWQTYGPAGFLRPVWCMGSQTQQTLRQLGVESQIVARPEDIAVIEG